ncbi:hypothetical protein [Serinicoccus marinus]|uniref:hypothetical protein n=1 Tax=Serinicoccus marinus TaxID=247333 RepID=UPI0024926355|nr:hypothetical protein [Serinicoccus marinus]
MTVTATTAVAVARSEEPRTVVREAGTLIVPAESLKDIARWGSSMLVVSVTGENARSTSSAGPGEVELGRDLSVRVEKVVWQHPQAVTTVSAGDQLSIYTFPGYVEINGQRSPARAQGSVRMEVGQRYVVALTDDIADGAQVLTLLNTFVYEANTIQLSDTRPLSQAQVSAELEDLTHRVNSWPEEGESLLQRVERVGQPR